MSCLESIVLVTDIALDSPKEVEEKIKAIEPGMERDCLPRAFFEVLRKALPHEEGKGTPLDSAKIIDIFVLLTRWTEFNKKTEDILSDEVHAIPVSSRRLDKLYGHDYPRYLTLLSEYGIITWAEGRIGYQTGEHSKYLAINRPFFSSSVSVVKYPSNKYIQKRREKGRRLDLWSLGDHHRFSVLTQHLEVKLSKALLVFSRAEGGWLSSSEIHRIASRKDMLVRIACKKISYWCDKYGRRHSELTRITKEDRGFLQIDGEDLGSIDIRSSQLQLLWAILGTATKEETGEARGIDGGSYVLHVSTLWKTLLDDEEKKEIRKELQRFRIDLDQDIYCVAPLWLVEDKELSRREFEKRGLLDRSKGKSLVMELLFGTPNEKRKKLLRCWKKRYPTISKALEIAKPEENSNLLVYALQGLESRIVLNEIGFELEARGINCIYIHDSVLCPLSRLSEAAQVFSERLSGYGLHNVIEVERVEEPTELHFRKSRPRKHNWKRHRDNRVRMQRVVAKRTRIPSA